MKLIHRVRQTIERYSLLEEGERVVVGFSGGPDSMALLDVLCSVQADYQLTLVPAHLNHGFRGDEAEEDLGFCEETASRYGLSLVSESVDLPFLIRSRGLSPQAAARDIRYGFLERTAEEYHAAKIALGHHGGDQAETLLMRLLRGAGARGLSGMPIRREPGIIRPLLHTTREEILLHLRERKIAFREDSSNQKNIYLRNRVRRELLPLLTERYNPNLMEDLQRTAQILGEEDALLEEEARKHFAPVRIPRGLALDVPGLRDLPRALVRRVVRLAIAGTLDGLSGFSFGHVDAVLKLMEVPGSSARVNLPRGLAVRKVYQRLEFVREGPVRVHKSPYEISIPGRSRIPDLEIQVEAAILSPGETQAPLGRDAALFDLDKCFLPLRVRTRTPGDTFYPKGLAGKKKVKRFFIDEKVPFPSRDQVPLLVNRRNEILWIGGYRTDARFAVDAGTSRALLVRIASLMGEAP